MASIFFHNFDSSKDVVSRVKKKLLYLMLRRGLSNVWFCIIKKLEKLSSGKHVRIMYTPLNPTFI